VQGTSVAQASVRVLNALGIEPLLLADERCCGHDLVWEGDVDGFLKLAQLNADVSEQHELTDRLKADMGSDSWLSKNIRPMTLIAILSGYFVFAILSAAQIEVNQKYVELLGQWGMLIMSFYFGGRTLEKIIGMKEKK
jgi:hypothetical protein